MALTKDSLDNFFNRPFFKSISKIFKSEVVDTINYPMEEMYLDVDEKLIEDIKMRCMTLGTKMSVDYFNITPEGDVLVNFNLLLKYAKEERMDELKIPEGITYLFFDPGYVHYSGKVIFPSSLKVFSPLQLNNLNDTRYNYGVLTMNYGELCEFGILDFQKCNELTVLLEDAFDNIKADEIILPESITEINCYFDENIQKVYVNSLVRFKKNLTDNIILKDNRLLYFDMDFDTMYQNFSFDNLRDEIIVAPGGDELGGYIPKFKKLYYPISELKLKFDYEYVEKEVISNPTSKNYYSFREEFYIFVCDLFNSYGVEDLSCTNYLCNCAFPAYNPFCTFIFLYMFDKIITSGFNSFYEEPLFSMIHNSYFHFKDGEFYSIYIYDENKDIDIYPVQKRDYVEFYSKRNKVYLYLERNLSKYKFEKPSL